MLEIFLRYWHNLPVCESEIVSFKILKFYYLWLYFLTGVGKNKTCKVWGERMFLRLEMTTCANPVKQCRCKWISVPNEGGQIYSVIGTIFTVSTRQAPRGVAMVTSNGVKCILPKPRPTAEGLSRVTAICLLSDQISFVVVLDGT